MNKKGFTLVELLAVLIILSLLAVISVTAVSKSLNQYRDRLYNTQKENIKSAARMWATDHKELLPIDDPSSSSIVCVYPNTCPQKYSVLAIDLAKLQDEGYIDKNLKNVKNKESLDNATVKITKIEGSKQYDYQLIVKKEVVYNAGDVITVNVNSTLKREFVVLQPSTSIEGTVRAILKENYSTNKQWCSKTNCDTFNLDNLPSNWDYVKSVSTLSYKDVETAKINGSINTVYGTAPAYWTIFGNTGSFWISGYMDNVSNGKSFDCTISITCTNSTCTGKAGQTLKDRSSTSGVRPVIVVSKDKIEQ